MTKITKQKLKGISERLDGICASIEEIASIEAEIQDGYPVGSVECEEHGYNVSSLEDAVGYIKDAQKEIEDSLEYEDKYEE